MIPFLKKKEESKGLPNLSWRGAKCIAGGDSDRRRFHVGGIWSAFCGPPAPIPNAADSSIGRPTNLIRSIVADYRRTIEARTHQLDTN